jgi:putative transposase
MELFKNKYRADTARLKTWDYSSYGEYFVTICAKDMKKYFGKIKNGIMGLNELGNAAAICWREIPSHFKFVELGAWVVMPNHVHGVIKIKKPYYVETQHFASQNKQNVSNKETQNVASLQNANKFGPQSQNLASIIRGFKIGVTKYAKLNNINFQWQSRFYDHVISNEFEAQIIHDYILKNPRK